MRELDGLGFDIVGTGQELNESAGLCLRAVQEPRDAVYLLVQLAARDYVAGVTLDELLDIWNGALADRLGGI